MSVHKQFLCSRKRGGCCEMLKSRTAGVHRHDRFERIPRRRALSTNEGKSRRKERTDKKLISCTSTMRGIFFYKKHFEGTRREKCEGLDRKDRYQRKWRLNMIVEQEMLGVLAFWPRFGWLQLRTVAARSSPPSPGSRFRVLCSYEVGRFAFCFLFGVVVIQCSLCYDMMTQIWLFGPFARRRRFFLILDVPCSMRQILQNKGGYSAEGWVGGGGECCTEGIRPD